MNYDEWADEYLKSANEIQKRIDKLKKERRKVTWVELSALNKRIRLLTSMYYDCLHNADALRKHKN